MRRVVGMGSGEWRTENGAEFECSKAGYLAHLYVWRLKPLLQKQKPPLRVTKPLQILVRVCGLRCFRRNFNRQSELKKVRPFESFVLLPHRLFSKKPV